MKLSSFFASLIAGLISASTASAALVEYHVPVPSADLEKFASFQVEVNCSREGESLVLNYAYPEELTGVPAGLTVRQSRFEPGFYFGENGEMKCVNSTCDVHYNGLPFNEAALIQKLKAISKDDVEFNSRLAVARFNHADPGGTFSEGPAEYCKF